MLQHPKSFCAYSVFVASFIHLLATHILSIKPGTLPFYFWLIQAFLRSKLKGGQGQMSSSLESLPVWLSSPLLEDGKIDILHLNSSSTKFISLACKLFFKVHTTAFYTAIYQCAPVLLNHSLPAYLSMIQNDLI